MWNLFSLHHFINLHLYYKIRKYFILFQNALSATQADITSKTVPIWLHHTVPVYAAVYNSKLTRAQYVVREYLVRLADILNI